MYVRDSKKKGDKTSKQKEKKRKKKGRTSN